MQSCQRICSFFGTFSPQLEQSCVSEAGRSPVLWALTGTTNKPAFSALFVSIDRKLDHPASNTDLANLVRARPLMFKSSCAITSYFDSSQLAVLKWKSFLLSATFLCCLPSCLIALSLLLLPFLRRDTRF